MQCTYSYALLQRIPILKQSGHEDSALAKVSAKLEIEHAVLLIGKISFGPPNNTRRYMLRASFVETHAYCQLLQRLGQRECLMTS